MTHRRRDRREKRREEARARQEARDARTDAEQLDVIAGRLGYLPEFSDEVARLRERDWPAGWAVRGVAG